MGRTGVTYQDVCEAAETLQGQQKSITIDNLRAILGTGSRGTLAMHLRTYKANADVSGASHHCPNSSAH